MRKSGFGKAGKKSWGEAGDSAASVPLRGGVFLHDPVLKIGASTESNKPTAAGRCR